MTSPTSPTPKRATPAVSSSDDGRSLLTADEVAAMLGMTAAWVYEQSRRGRIPTVTLGRYRRYRRAAIEEWVRELESGSMWASNMGPLRTARR